MKHPDKPFVCCAWKDAHGSATAAYDEHELPHAPIYISTYGFLVRHDAAGVSVASEFCGDGTWRGVTFIPSEIVVEIVELGMRKTRRSKSRGPSNEKSVASGASASPADPKIHCT